MAAKANKDDIEEENIEEKKVDDFSVAVLDSIRKRGLDTAKYEVVDTCYLWPGNYRVNCYSKHKIVNSYFIRYSHEEGILRMWPNLGE